MFHILLKVENLANFIKTIILFRFSQTTEIIAHLIKRYKNVLHWLKSRASGTLIKNKTDIYFIDLETGISKILLQKKKISRK